MEEQFNNEFDNEVINQIPEKRHQFNETEKGLMTQACAYVYSISKWMKFFFVLMIICIAFMVIGGLCAIITSPLMGSLSDAGIDMPFWIFGVLYLACAVVYIFPALYMKRAANAADIAIHSNSNEAVVEFLKNNKSLWKFCGILTIVMLGISILMIPIMVIIIAAVA